MLVKSNRGLKFPYKKYSLKCVHASVVLSSLMKIYVLKTVSFVFKKSLLICLRQIYNLSNFLSKNTFIRFEYFSRGGGLNP